MKKLFFVLAMSSFAVVMADAAEQDTVNHCAEIIHQFQQMPEQAIPRDVLRHARGLAIMSVVKAGFIFSAKGGQGVAVARTPYAWSGPSFIATGGGGWGLQAGVEVTDFVIVLNNDAAVQAFSRGGNAPDMWTVSVSQMAYLRAELWAKKARDHRLGPCDEPRDDHPG